MPDNSHNCHCFARDDRLTRNYLYGKKETCGQNVRRCGRCQESMLESVTQHPGSRLCSGFFDGCRRGRSTGLGGMMRVTAGTTRTTPAARFVCAAFVSFPGRAVAGRHDGQVRCTDHARCFPAAGRALHRGAVLAQRAQRAESATPATLIVVHRHDYLSSLTSSPPDPYRA
jgi:hypothetical protein